MQNSSVYPPYNSLKGLIDEKFFELIIKKESSVIRNILKQFEKINEEVLTVQKKVLVEHNKKIFKLFPFKHFNYVDQDCYKEMGQGIISEGKVGCLLIAGGQGTRLHMKGPKGLYPISNVKSKTLFQLHAERVLSAGKQVGRDLQLAIMTSPLNHLETVNYFKKNNYFGLKPGQVDFFEQDMLPFLDEKGNLILESTEKIACGPDGNGYALFKFFESGLWQKWVDRGISVLNFIIVDNALADPFDSELIGFHDHSQAEITVKCVVRKDANEKVGLLVKENDKTKVIEYSEMPPEEKVAMENGHLKHMCANISLFCFQMDFIKKSYAEYKNDITLLPLHKAFKATNYLNLEGKEIESKSPNAWKFEYFIFDVLAFSNNVKALLYPREFCFAPLKNFSGDDSPETVKKILLNYDRFVLEQITGESPPEDIIELDSAFYYPTEDLLNKWLGKRITEGGYILP